MYHCTMWTNLHYEIMHMVFIVNENECKPWLVFHILAILNLLHNYGIMQNANQWLLEIICPKF